MRDDLVPPAFADGHLEISWRGGQVSIDATYEGLVRLLQILNSLRDQVERTKRNEHVHLEDYEILTSTSPPCVIGVFVEPERISQTAGVSSQGVSPRSGFWQTLKKRLFRGRLWARDAALARQITAAGASIAAAWGWIQINGQWIQYRVHVLANGIITVGTYFPVSGPFSNRWHMRNSQWRPLSPLERALIKRWLEPDFPGKEQLVRQVASSMVTTIDENGSIKFTVEGAPPASEVKYRVPTEGEFVD